MEFVQNLVEFVQNLVILYLEEEDEGDPLVVGVILLLLARGVGQAGVGEALALEKV